MRKTYVLLMLGLGTAAVAMAAPPRESNIRESAESVSLGTDDGLGLTLERGNGSGLVLELDGRTVSLGGAPLLRFEEVLEVEGAPDLLGGGADAWGVPAESVDESVNGHAGPWLRVSTGDDRRPKRTIEIGQTEPQPLILSGSCQARVKGSEFGWWNRNLALNANVVYTDGERMPELSAYFGQYDHGPQFNRRIICPDRPIERVDLDLSVPPGDCTAWYRDVELRRAAYRIVSPQGPLERVDARVLQEFVIEDAALRGLVTYEVLADAIEIRCRFESTDPVDRAVSAYVAIPLDCVGGTWHDHFRGARTIEPGVLYRDGFWYGVGRDGYNNRYPIACVETADGAGLAIGTSVAEPRVFQTEYDAARRELRIRFDIGLSPDAGRWANRGEFSVYLYRYDTRDGFRDAADRYYRLFEWAFRKRVEREGIWLAFMSPLSIAGGWEDLHFQFLEGLSDMGWAERQGMLSLCYTQPWHHHHEFPAEFEADEVHGPAVPRASINLARRIAARTDRDVPLDTRRRYAAYLAGYAEDPWGEPNGYFFRHPEGGDNRNMMFVNPNDRLPPGQGVPFSSGGWDREIIREVMGVHKQWFIEGWTQARCTSHPFLEIDGEHKASGKQSVRLDAVQAKSRFERNLRGLAQEFYYNGEEPGPFRLSYSVRAENVPENGTDFEWRVSFYYQDGAKSTETFRLDGLNGDWQRGSFTAAPERRPMAVRVGLFTSSAWVFNPTVLWVDDVSLTVGDDGVNLLKNGGFEQAELLPCRLDGVYLDTVEPYECDLNYRRGHWPYAEEPLTFDCARRPAMHQVFSHVTFARHMAEWLHPRGMVVFGNCVPVGPFVTPYLDILGTELFWKQGGSWTPWPDAKFNHARFMARAKPYCILQYSDLDVDEQTRYVKRCLFYGVFPSNQGAPDGGWYWTDPVVVARHRPVFAKYVPFIIEVAKAGWQPLTLAAADNDAVWLERFGEGNVVYFTAFNATGEPQSATVTLDPRAGMTAQAKLEERIQGRSVAWRPGGGRRPSFDLELGPEDVAVFRVERGG